MDSLLDEVRSRKRRRASPESKSHHSLTSSISPPPKRNARREEAPRVVTSPFQLTTIKDLPASSNVHAVSLGDILGDPLIAECWEFNYLHDLDFLMKHFDEDTRALVKVHVVHGFWKRESPQLLNIKIQASNYENITLHTAYMPEMFGTHHSKMLILIRSDDTAQVIIHTANMISIDWNNLTNGLWRSPLLPLCKKSVSPSKNAGSKFKMDLLNYLRAYNTKRIVCESLVTELDRYDFSAVRATLVASVPCKQSLKGESETSWGWLGLKAALRSVPSQSQEGEIVAQISSIATLGQDDSWLDGVLFDALRTSSSSLSDEKSSNESSGSSKSPSSTNPNFHIIFPTPDEIRRSLNGYSSGASIHTKIQTPPQVKQLEYLRPFLRRWANDTTPARNFFGITSPTPVSGRVDSSPRPTVRSAGRRRAAPHIKTYTRFTDASMSRIDWMLLTSANISKQAWGEPAKNGAVRICSYEIGVLVWPDLFRDDDGGADPELDSQVAGADKHKIIHMAPVFQRDSLDMNANADVDASHIESRMESGDPRPTKQPSTIIALRMPYDLPLVPYSRTDKPWCATARYTEKDWKGHTWTGA